MTWGVLGIGILGQGRESFTSGVMFTSGVQFANCARYYANVAFAGQSKILLEIDLPLAAGVAELFGVWAPGGEVVFGKYG